MIYFFLEIHMENQINAGDQNTQQIEQNPVSQTASVLDKPKVNYWMTSSLIFGFLLLVITLMFLFRSRYSEKNAPRSPTPETSVVPTNTDDLRVGDNESYIDFSVCDQWTQYVIDKKSLPRKMIHSCKSSQKILDAEKVYLADVFFGPPDDCPSGCIYKRFISVVKPDKSSFDQLPSGPEGILNSVWAQPPLDTARNYSGFECPSQLEDYIDITLGKLETKYGWNLNFRKSLVCNWEEFDRVKQIINKRSLTMNGNFFVYIDSGQEYWDLDRLIWK